MSNDLELRRLIDAYRDPLICRELGAVGAVESARFQRGSAEIALKLAFPAAGYASVLQAALTEAVRERFGVPAEVRVRSEIGVHAVQKNLQPLAGIRNVIAVASGKGGVGKSTVAVNLALALAADGAQVGLLDADIYGPSQPRMLGVGTVAPETVDGRRMEPVQAHGLQTMSIGYLIDEEQPTVWRGPMATQALMQLLGETRWHELDYLVVDLPPGTGDIQLTLSQRIPISGAIIVTTPQDIATLDARKGAEMFRKVEVSVLGVVENMSFFCCPNCGHSADIFGSGGGERLARASGVELLGQLPLDGSIRELADGGRPTVVGAPDSDAARRYRDIARRATARLAYGAVEVFPTVTVSDD